MKKIASILFFLLISFTILGQETIFEEKRTIYKRENSYGIVLHTSGWGITYRYGLYTSGFTRRIIEAEIVGIKHPKETKSYSSIFDNSNGYKYGKLNSITLFKGSYGFQNTFISKQSVKGIAIAYVLNGGITFAYAKPTYLEVIFIDEVTGLPKSAIEKYDPNKHNQSDIIGKASLFRGMFQGKFYPGINGKFGLNFESSKQADRINSIEVGATLDLFLQEVPIMANEANSQYYFNLYLAITFGSKKTE